jgi:hypothetical protein
VLKSKNLGAEYLKKFCPQGTCSGEFIPPPRPIADAPYGLTNTKEEAKGELNENFKILPSGPGAIYFV